MGNSNSRWYRFGSSPIFRALACSLLLHAMLVMQATPDAWRVPSGQSPNASAFPLRATVFGSAGYAAMKGETRERTTLSGGSWLPPESTQRPTSADSPTRAGEAGASGRTGNAEEALSHAVAEPESESSATHDLTGQFQAARGPEAGGMRRYRLNLAAESRRFKHYPEQAVRQGWSGTVEIGINVLADGTPQPAQVLRSSGYLLLDTAALEMLSQAARYAQVPPGLRGQAFSVRLPVEFNATSVD